MGSFVRKIDFHTIAKSPSGYFFILQDTQFLQPILPQDYTKGMRTS